MKAVIVNCFDTFEERVDLVHEFLCKKGYEVKVIQSDFRHIKKTHRIEGKKDFIFIKTKPYYKNISFNRFISHYKYASEAFKAVSQIRPDLLYVFVPPNSLAKFAAEYKKNNKNVKLIYDLIDLWPETMPIGKGKSIPPFTLWRDVRNRNLKISDIVITECDLYQTVLKDVLKGVNTETLHLAKRDIKVKRNTRLSESTINLAYLGSINNIIDISKIADIIKAINTYKLVTLHIVGDGESTQELINQAKSAGALVEFHGKIYDAQKKQDIFDKCHFGLNIMKDSVCVGLTMKSIDYFQHGLPIINNIPADTKEIVEKYSAGYNLVQGADIAVELSEIKTLKMEEILKMRDNAIEIYQKKFSNEAYFKKINEIYKEYIVYE